MNRSLVRAQAGPPNRRLAQLEERLSYMQDVTGSIPVSSTICGSSSVGRALPCQGKGREFESRLPLHKLP